MSTNESAIINFNASFESCTQQFENYVLPSAELYCNWTWDSVLCWPPTRAGSEVRQKCGLIRDQKGIDPTQYASRYCLPSGLWAGKPGANRAGHNNNRGWTNYTTCWLPEIRELFRRLGDDEEGKLLVASRTRVLEIVGLTISLAALLVSLGIFFHFRSLRNNRTRIHKNLFAAMMAQVVIRLSLYIDQALVRNYSSNGAQQPGIENTAYLCVSCYILLEYLRTAMFLWMFIEGVYLHGIVTVSVFTSQRFPMAIYCTLGWGLPAIMTTIWAVSTALKHSQVARDNCWFGYNLSPYYWILEGPRMAVIVLNFMFLLNIVRVLVVKLRQSRTSDIQQVRKAVRAAVVLLPLLGITNLLNMAEAPLARPAWEFALWSYVTHTLTSFQGFAIALIYCFLNGEVRTAITKTIRLHLAFRGGVGGSNSDQSHHHQNGGGGSRGTASPTTASCCYQMWSHRPRSDSQAFCATATEATTAIGCGQITSGGLEIDNFTKLSHDEYEGARQKMLINEETDKDSNNGYVIQNGKYINT